MPVVLAIRGMLGGDKPKLLAQGNSAGTRIVSVRDFLIQTGLLS